MSFDLDLMWGIAGMVLLLTGFILNLLKIKDASTKTYIILNILGAGISTYYAYTLHAVPFIVLEAVWCFFAVYKLFVVMGRKARA